MKKRNTKTVYVGNLNYQMDEFAVERMFRKFGKVNYVKLIKDEKTKKNKGIAFVEMNSANAGDTAIELLNGKVVSGRTLKVSEAIDSREQEEKERKKFSYKTPQTSKKQEVNEIKMNKRKNSKQGLQHLFDNLRNR